jgi:HAD superfamily hydrolase (TIGR01458 family)
MTPLRAVLIDLAGVLHVGDVALPGAREALERLRASGLALRFLTNTTRRTRQRLTADLLRLGFEIAPEEVVTAASAARDFLLRHGLHPHVLVHTCIAEEFADLASDEPDSVLLGDAAQGFSYPALDRCFRVLMDDPARPLIAMARNRYFRQPDGLHLDMGAFVAALEYACGRPAIVTGKPTPEFFLGALATAAAAAAAAVGAAVGAASAATREAVMIGDDVEADIGGAMALGIAGILVRTGKFQPEDEARARALGAEVADDFAAAVGRVLKKASS